MNYIASPQPASSWRRRISTGTMGYSTSYTPARRLGTDADGSPGTSCYRPRSDARPTRNVTPDVNPTDVAVNAEAISRRLLLRVPLR